MSALGVLEAITGAIGEMVNDFGGLRMTRLIGDVAIGATTLTVEYSNTWPAQGIVSIDGATYHYTGNGDGSLTGVYYLLGGVQVSGTKIAHRNLTAVMDVSQSYSALDQIRQAMLVQYAQGDDLSALGRNLGVLRFPDVKSDDQFRGIIEAFAYNPKGTLYGLTLAMNALVGAGNYSISEDLVSNPCTVYISIPGSVFLDAFAQGKAYLTGPQPLVAATNAFTWTLPATTYPYVRANSITLVDLNFLANCRTARPSAYTIAAQYPGDPGVTPFAFVGTSETADVSIISSAGAAWCQFVTNQQAYYTYGAPIVPASTVRLSALCAFPNAAGSDARQTGGYIQDKAASVGWGVSSAATGLVTLGLINPATGAAITNNLIGGAATFAQNTFYEITLYKKQQSYVDLLVNGQLVQRALYSAFPTTTNNAIAFGELIAGYTPNTQFKAVGVYAHTTTDYWSASGTDGVVSSPTTLTISSSTFAAGDVGKQVRITNSAASNAQGGNNNCLMQIASVVSSTQATIIGPVVPGEDAQVNSIHPTRITVTDLVDVFRYPDDLGKEITLANSTQGNNGTYVIARLLDPNTQVNLATYATVLPSYTNVCEVVSASFVPETGLTYQITPQFVAESGLTWELSDAGAQSASGAVYTIEGRQALPYPNGIYNLGIDTYLSAQVLPLDTVLNELEAVGPPPTYTYWPFYVNDPYNFVEEYINTIVAAGINVVFNFT